MRTPRNAVARKRHTREPYDRVLIVCEGAKTEPNYFTELANHYKLSTANVEIVGSGSDPLEIVKKGKELQHKERRTGEKYDRVYCVFDQDEHTRFQEASMLAEKNDFRLGRSWPCFEFWILLHFCFTRRPYSRSQGRSSAENCIRDLRQRWPDYEKARSGIFLELRDAMDRAMKHANRAKIDAEQTGEPNPSTEVHRLVTYLGKLKNS